MLCLFPPIPKDPTFVIYCSWNNIIVFTYFIQIQLWFPFWERSPALIFKYQLNILIVLIIYELILNKCNS